jgi:hypothetical protein
MSEIDRFRMWWTKDDYMQFRQVLLDYKRDNAHKVRLLYNAQHCNYIVYILHTANSTHSDITLCSWCCKLHSITMCSRVYTSAAMQLAIQCKMRVRAALVSGFGFKFRTAALSSNSSLCA